MAGLGPGGTDARAPAQPQPRDSSHSRTSKGSMNSGGVLHQGGYNAMTLRRAVAR